MAAAYICDRCGKASKYSDKLNCINKARRTHSRSVENHGYYADLCDDCMKSFEEWFSEGKRKDD